MATIEKRKGKRGTTYRALIRMKRVTESATFRSLDSARRWARTTEEAIEQGKYFAKAEAAKHTVKEVVDRYIADVAPSLKSGRERDRHLTWWAEQIGNVTLADLSPALIAEKRDELARTATARGERSPATVNRYLAALSHAMTMAVREWQWLEVNPVQNVTRKKEPRGRVRFLSDKERKALLKACKEIDPEVLHPLVLLAISTGARQGELLGLRWKDVDLKKGVAILHETKNDERRSIPIAGSALEILKERKRKRVPRIGDDRVFPPNRHGQTYFPRDNWVKALEAAKIDDLRFHDLRHTAASYLAMSGATLAEIAEVLGHKTLAMVKRYSHLTEQHTSAVVARMNEKYLSDAS